ncbi:neurofilament medium polypeptide-like isoform X2 [Mytilus trossulus]
MSVLCFDGEIIQIPEYIVRIVKRAQEIIASENEGKPTINILDGEVLSRSQTDESEPKVRGPDGNVQTLSEYILGIIRAAQKIVQEDSPQEEDIKDYDKFIDNTFEAMLSEVDSSDSNDESTAVIQGVVDKLIDEVCSSPKLKMPEMESSSVSTFQEEPQNVASDIMSEVDNKIEKANSVLENGITSAENIEVKNIVTENDTNNAKDITKTEISNASEGFREIKNDIEEIAVEKVEKISPDISNDELEKIAEKFVENICNDAKNEFFVEEENKANEKTDSIKDSDEGIDKDLENQDKEGTNEDDNGQIDKEEEEEASENKIQNHSAKVHPEESKPTVANSEDITQTESLPTEGKTGKDQKYDVTKDKIKPKRRSRGIRNSFRRMFSCFSTKSSQLE